MWIGTQMGTRILNTSIPPLSSLTLSGGCGHMLLGLASASTPRCSQHSFHLYAISPENPHLS